MAQRQRSTDARAGGSRVDGASGRPNSADRRSGRGRPPAVDRTQEGPGQERTLSGVELAALRTRLRAVVEPVVIGVNLDLDDLVVARAGRRFVVRVTVDGDAGIGHDELSGVSREISAALDVAEQSAGEFPADAYTLEVSSPGVDRPLTLPRHWRRNVGRLVKVRADGKTLTVRVLAVDDAGVTFDGLAAAVAFAQLGPGRVQIEFNRLEDLGDDEFGAEILDDDPGGDEDAHTDPDDGDDMEEEVQA